MGKTYFLNELNLFLLPTNKDIVAHSPKPSIQSIVASLNGLGKKPAEACDWWCLEKINSERLGFRSGTSFLTIEIAFLVRFLKIIFFLPKFALQLWMNELLEVWNIQVCFQ